MRATVSGAPALMPSVRKALPHQLYSEQNSRLFEPAALLEARLEQILQRKLHDPWIIRPSQLAEIRIREFVAGIQRAEAIRHVIHLVTKFKPLTFLQAE